MAKKNHSSVPSEKHVPCDYKRPIPGLEYGTNSRPLSHMSGGRNASMDKIQHPVMKTHAFDEQTPQLCHNSTTNGKRR